MDGTGIQSAEVVFLLLLALVISFTALARKLQTPYPIVLVVAGLLISFAPGNSQVFPQPGGDLSGRPAAAPLFRTLGHLLA